MVTQIASDLHLNNWKIPFYFKKDVDLIMCAGDICNGLKQSFEF